MSITVPEVQLLRTIPLFAKMTDSELAELGQLLRGKKLEANKTLFWMGDPGEEFYIIQTGEIELLHIDEEGKENSLAILKAGHFFGELALLDGGPRTATARTRADTSLLTLGRADLEKYLLSHASAAWHILVILGQRQRDMLDKLRGIKNVNEIVQEKTSHWHKISDAVAASMTTPYFIVAQIGIVLCWVIIARMQGEKAFDPYPFNLLSLIVGVEALFLSAFLLVSQGRQGERDRIRADADYSVNLKAHLEVMQLHQKLDRLEQSLKKGVSTPAEDDMPGQV